MQQVEFRAVSKSFAATPVLTDIDLSIADSEFVALLGPSGCGKTTLLRLIAGLEAPSAGSIRIAGATVADAAVFVEPEERNLGMVFQSYALWPHMSVADNVAFGLKLRRLPRGEREGFVRQALATVGLTGFEDRRPQALSGGQRQRVALARCLALQPRLILLDEPLANLDAHLRASMQREFRRIHRQTGTTFVFVTHDQGEAMALADRVVVMDHGRVQQAGSPEDLYARPQTGMVARFIGRGVTLPVEVERINEDGTRAVRLAGKTIDMPGTAGTGPALACLRPEHLTLVAPDSRGLVLSGSVDSIVYRGGTYAVGIALPEAGGAVVEAHTDRRLLHGEVLALEVRSGWVLPADEAG